jgi:WD40 repeat protein
LTGSQDGSVHIWEWGHPQTVAEPRAAGTFAKVTRVRFSQHGNKFGVADGDGNLSLFNVGLTSSNYRPFYVCLSLKLLLWFCILNLMLMILFNFSKTFQCHNKVTSDFVFLGSCSLIATTGHSSENRNVALWDTLLPYKKSLVTGNNVNINNFIAK